MAESAALLVDAVLLASILYGYRATITVAGGLRELIRPTAFKRAS